MTNFPQSDPRVGVALTILSSVAVDLKDPMATNWSVAKLRDQAADFLSSYLKDEPSTAKAKGSK